MGEQFYWRFEGLPLTFRHRFRASDSATSPTAGPSRLSANKSKTATDEAAIIRQDGFGPEFGRQTSIVSPSANPDNRRPLSDDQHRHSTAGRAVEADVTMYLDPDIEAESGEGQELPFGSFGEGLGAAENIGGDDPGMLLSFSFRLN
jgi:hypothetical protein